MANSLLDLYTKLIETCDMVIDNDNYIKVVTENNDKLPVMLDGNPLVLPTKEHINTVMGTGEGGTLVKVKTLFHPMLSLATHQNPSIVKLRKAFSYRLNYSIMALFETLITLASTPELQIKPSKSKLEFLTSLPSNKKGDIGDERSIHNIMKVFSNGMKKHPDKFFIKLYIKKNMEINNEKFKKGVSVTFPLLDELVSNAKSKMYGVSLRKKDIDLIIGVYSFVFPDTVLGDPNVYLYGSNGSSCDLDALMKAMKGVGSNLNHLIHLHRGGMEDYKSAIIPMEWKSYIGHLDKLSSEVKQIPASLIAEDTNDVAEPLNEKHVHKPTSKGVPPSELLSRNMNTTKPVQTVMPQQHVTTPEVQRTSKGLDPASIIPQQQMQPPQQQVQIMQQVPQQQIQQQPMQQMQPQQFVNQPNMCMQPQQFQQQPVQPQFQQQQQQMYQQPMQQQFINQQQMYQQPAQPAWGQQPQQQMHPQQMNYNRQNTPHNGW